MNTLLDDFLAEQHNHILEKGNLKKKQNWTGENSWSEAGHTAHILVSTCQLCGTVSKTLTGIFSLSVSPSGSKKLLAVADKDYPNIPPGNRHTEETHITPSVCPHCIFALGFRKDYAI